MGTKTTYRIYYVHVITFLFAGGRSGRGRVRCQECGKQFADNYCLKRHMISHTGKAVVNISLYILRIFSNDQ